MQRIVFCALTVAVLQLYQPSSLQAQQWMLATPADSQSFNRPDIINFFGATGNQGQQLRVELVTIGGFVENSAIGVSGNFVGNFIFNLALAPPAGGWTPDPWIFIPPFGRTFHKAKLFRTNPAPDVLFDTNNPIWINGM